ncbi:hypothetical protein J6590_080210 [Homalodisca vitripennis]|nr:hypothetical protein J6590_080210 [Homalodisca vitripennis]
MDNLRGQYYDGASNMTEETLKANPGEGGHSFQFKDWEVESPTSTWAPTSGKELLGIISSIKSKTSAGLDDFS